MKNKLIFGFISLLIIGGVSYILSNNAVSQLSLPGTFTTYTQAKDFSFIYPPNWIINDRTNSNELFPYVQISNYNPDAFASSPYAQNDYFKVEIVKIKNENKLTLQEWINDLIQKSDTNPKVLKSIPANVNGNKAIYNIEQAMGITHAVVYIEKGDYVYAVNSTQLTKEFEPVFNIILNSIIFK